MPLPPAYAEKMAAVAAADRLRQRHTVQRLPGGYVIKNGRQLLSFSDNDYLGLSFHPALQESAAKTIKDYGCGAGASRLITGNHPLYARLESRLAQFKSTEDALLFGSGYLANIGVIPALAGKGDLILADRLVHASLIDAVRLSGATFKRFHHNDATHAAELLEKHRDRYHQCLIITEGVFSMDGDVAPLEELILLAEQNDCLLVVDDAHGFGVVEHGSSLRGAKGDEATSPHNTGGLPRRPSGPPRNDGNNHTLTIGTFSKAAGSYGGYVCGSKAWMEYLLNHSRSVIYTTGLPPATVAANIAALEVMAAEPERAQKARANARLFSDLLDLSPPPAAIVPVILGEAGAALQASQALEENGFLVAAIRPPTVPEGTARLRFAFSAVHEKADIETLAKTVKKEAGKIPA